MGQLERYGLYVLVLVIFLILGVAIWGGDPQAVRASSGVAEQLNPETNLSTSSGEDGLSEQAATRSEGFDDLFGDLVDLPTGAVLDSAPAGDPEGLESLVPVELPAPIAAAPTYRTYIVRGGDIGGDIAKRELGRASAWSQIEAINPGIDTKRLKIGQELKIPISGATTEIARSGQSGKERRYTVQSGDYLGSISQKYYNTARYADWIGEANNITDPRNLPAGKVLIIPAPPEK